MRPTHSLITVFTLLSTVDAVSITTIQDTDLSQVSYEGNWKHWPNPDGQLPDGMVAPEGVSHFSWSTEGGNVVLKFRGSSIIVDSSVSHYERNENVLCQLGSGASQQFTLQVQTNPVQNVATFDTSSSAGTDNTLSCHLTNADGNILINIVSFDVTDYRSAGSSQSTPSVSILDPDPFTSTLRQSSSSQFNAPTQLSAQQQNSDSSSSTTSLNISTIPSRTLSQPNQSASSNLSGRTLFTSSSSSFISVITKTSTTFKSEPPSHLVLAIIIILAMSCVLLAIGVFWYRKRSRHKLTAIHNSEEVPVRANEIELAIGNGKERVEFGNEEMDSQSVDSEDPPPTYTSNEVAYSPTL